MKITIAILSAIALVGCDAEVKTPRNEFSRIYQEAEKQSFANGVIHAEMIIDQDIIAGKDRPHIDELLRRAWDASEVKPTCQDTNYPL